MAACCKATTANERLQTRPRARKSDRPWVQPHGGAASLLLERVVGAAPGDAVSPAARILRHPGFSRAARGAAGAGALAQAQRSYGNRWVQRSLGPLRRRCRCQDSGQSSCPESRTSGRGDPARAARRELPLLYSGWDDAHVASRNYADPDAAIATLGFRCAR